MKPVQRFSREKGDRETDGYFRIYNISTNWLIYTWSHRSERIYSNIFVTVMSEIIDRRF